LLNKVEAGLGRVSGTRAVTEGPLGFNTVSIDLRKAINDLKRWLTQYTSEAQLLAFGDHVLTARVLDRIQMIRVHIRQLENASGTLSNDAADLSKRRAAYSKFETAGHSLIKDLRGLEKDLK
jgi:hypothetical protein